MRLLKQAALVFMLLSSVNIFAFDLDLQFRTSLGWLGQGTDTSSSSSTSPNGISASQILNDVGTTVRMSWTQWIGFAPGLDVYLDEYVYLDDYGRAFPTQTMTGIDTGDLALVLNLQLNLPWYATIPVSDLVTVNLAAGPAVILRIPLGGIDGTTDTSQIRQYLMGEGRWMYLYLEPAAEFALRDNFSFSTGTKILLPVWHAWDSTTLPFYDTLYAGFELGFIIKL